MKKTVDEHHVYNRCVVKTANGSNLYCRAKGAIEWWCPKCHAFNKTMVTYRTFKIHCTNRECGLRFVYGFVLMAAPSGHQDPPPDRIAPLFDELFPDKWKSGQPANRYMPDTLGSSEPNTDEPEPTTGTR